MMEAPPPAAYSSVTQSKPGVDLHYKPFPTGGFLYVQLQTLDLCLPPRSRLGAASKEPAEGFAPCEPLLKTLELRVILEFWSSIRSSRSQFRRVHGRDSEYIEVVLQYLFMASPKCE